MIENEIQVKSLIVIALCKAVTVNGMFIQIYIVLYSEKDVFLILCTVPTIENMLKCSKEIFERKSFENVPLACENCTKALKKTVSNMQALEWQGQYGV